MKKLIIALSLIVISGKMKAQSKVSLLEEAKKAIAASNAIYSDLVNKNDGSILTRYTEDACLLPPNAAPICGKENIINFFKGGPQVHSIFKIQHIYGNGSEFVTEESNYELYDMNNNKIDEGKVMVIWKKTKAGWKMHRDMFSSNRKPQP